MGEEAAFAVGVAAWHALCDPGDTMCQFATLTPIAAICSIGFDVKTLKFHLTQELLRRMARHRMARVLVAFGVVLLLGTSAFAQFRRKAAGPPLAADEEIAWEKYLVKDAPEPTIRFAVMHQHAGRGCYGYLYITRETIRFEVVQPESDREHGFSYPRSSITEARQWKVMASRLPEAEFKFLGGKTYHFFRIRESLVDEPSPKFRWEDARTWQPLVEAATHFNEVLRSVEQHVNAQKPATSAGPTVRVMEPAVSDPNVPTEVAQPVVSVRGAALDARGVLSVTVNGVAAQLRSSGDIKAVEFSVDGVTLQEGLNRVTVVATNVDHRSTQLVVPLWLRGAGTPAPAPPASSSPAPVTTAAPAPPNAEVAPSPATTPPPAPKIIPGEPVTVEIFSQPIGADIMLDGNFVGNTPSILKIRPGTHYLNLLLPGFKPWDQPLSLEAGGKLTTIRATLEKIE